MYQCGSCIHGWIRQPPAEASHEGRELSKASWPVRLPLPHGHFGSRTSPPTVLERRLNLT